MRCIIIEDQPPAQRILKKYIGDYGSLELVGTFTDALQALDFLKADNVDLMFLDIHLPKLSGIDFLKALDNPPAVILTTAFADFALESYDLNVVDYLLKPFSFLRFIKAVSKVEERNSTAPTSQSEVEPIYIKSGHEYHKVEIDKILFIHSDRDYTEIQTSSERYLSSESLKYWEEFLLEHKFLRVHKSYLVNENVIVKVKASAIEITGEYSIPIGRVYKDNVNSLLNNNLLINK